MSPEELFEEYQYLAEQTLYKGYKFPREIAKQHRIELDDLMQYANTGLWKACISYDESKCKFTTHAINQIKFHINERLKRECYIMKLEANRKYSKEELSEIYSLDYDASTDTNEPMTFHEITPSLINVEVDAIGNNVLDTLLSNLDEREQKIVKLRMNDKSTNEIAELFNMSGQNVRYIIRKIREKLSNKLIVNY